MSWHGETCAVLNFHPIQPLGASATWTTRPTVELRDGPGTWNATNSSRWSPDSASPPAKWARPWDNTAAAQASFGISTAGAAGTVTVVGSVLVSSILFGATRPGYVLIGGEILLSNPDSLITAAGTASIYSALTSQGGGMLTKGGSGLLLLGGSITGFTQLNLVAGTLALADSALTGGFLSTPLAVGTGATLKFNSSSNVNITGTLSGGGTVWISGGGHILYRGINVGSRGYTNPAGFTGTFISPAMQSAPVFSAPAETVLRVGATVNRPIGATDPDGDAMTYSVSSNGGKGSVAIVGATINYTSTTNGGSNVGITALDALGASTTGQIPFYALNYTSAVDGPRPHFGPPTEAVSGIKVIAYDIEPGLQLICDTAFSGPGRIDIAYGRGLNGIVTTAYGGALTGAPSFYFNGSSTGFSGTINIWNDAGTSSSVRTGLGDPASTSQGAASLGTANINFYLKTFEVYYAASALNFSLSNANATNPGVGPEIQITGGNYTLASIPTGGVIAGSNQSLYTPSATTVITLSSLSLSSSRRLSNSNEKSRFVLQASPNLSMITFAPFTQHRVDGAPSLLYHGTYTLASWAGTSTGVPEVVVGSTSVSPSTVGSNKVWVIDASTITLNPASGITVTTP